MERLQVTFDIEILLNERAFMENSPNSLMRSTSDDQHTIEVGQNLYLNQNVIYYLIGEGKLNRYLNRLITRGKSSLANFILRLFYLTKLVDLSNALVDFNWLDWMIVSERKVMVDVLAQVMKFNSIDEVNQLFVKAIVNQEKESFIRLCKLAEKSIIDCTECNPIHLFFMVPIEWIEESWDSLKNLRDSEGRNLLMIASMNDNLSLFKQILGKFGKEVLLLTDFRGRTVLHHSAIHGSLSIFKYLMIDEKQSICSDVDGYSPLFLASIYDRVEIFEYILSIHNEISLFEQADHPKKPTCYHLAAMYGSFKILNWFLVNKDKYQFVKFKDAKNNYPTFWCLEIGLNIYIVDYFMRNEYYYLNESKSTFPICFTELDYLQILQYLSKYKNSFTLRQSNQLDCLSTAANLGHLRIVKYLIEELGINPENCEYQADKNIAHLSVGSKNKELIEYIFQKFPHLALEIDKAGNIPLEYVPLNNLDVHIFKVVLPKSDNFLETHLKSVQRCLSVACSMGRIDILKYLIEELKVNPNFLAHPYMSPILQASTMGQLECLQYLLENGADPLMNNNGENILHAAASHGHLAILEFLETRLSKEILHQLMNQISTIKRSSPVNYAIYYGQANIVEWLLDHGADINMTTLEGYSFLHGASVVGALDIVKLLVEKYRVSITTRNVYGLRAVDLAVEHGYFLVANYLLEKEESSESLGKLVERLVKTKDAKQRNLFYRIIENGKRGEDKEYYEQVLIKIFDYLINGISLLEQNSNQANLLSWVTQHSVPFHKYPMSESEKGKYYGFLSAYITNAESSLQTSYESDEYLSFTEPTPFTITVENERESKESLLLKKDRECEFIQIKEFGKTGRQGKVFIFYNLQLKRLFVFKFYKYDDSGISTTKFDEFKMMEKCRYHPNIVTSISLVKSKNILKDCDSETLVMDYMNGGTLRDEISIFHDKLIFEYSPSKFAVHLLSLVSDLTIHMMNAFIHIHERHSMIHRDIKPENILIHFTNNLKYYVLGDFGLARIVDAQFSSSYGNGTPRYQSPSVLKHNYGKEVDFWSLGCTLIEVILNPLTTIHNYRESRDECLRLLKGKCEYYDTCLALVENFEHFKPFSMFYKLIQKMVDEKLSTTLSATNVLLENPFLVKANLLTLNHFGANFPMIIEEKDIYESMKERFKDLEIPYTENINSEVNTVEEIDEVERLRRENEKMKKMMEQLGLKF